VVAHSFADAQAPPAFFFGAQAKVLVQYEPDAQSSSVAQVVLHVVAPHTYGSHGVVDVSHVLPPLQILPETTPAVHVVAPHAAPFVAYLRHAPAPSHFPSARQVVG